MDHPSCPPTPLTLLRAGPGAGKTAFLVERARAALAAGVPTGHVLCLALDGAAAELLERRLLEGLAAHPLSLPVVLTYEQVARQILAEAHGDSTERFLDPVTERLLVRRALADTASSARHFRAEALRESERFRNEVADFIAELTRHKLTPEQFRDQVLPDLPEAGALADLADVYERLSGVAAAGGRFRPGAGCSGWP